MRKSQEWAQVITADDGFTQQTEHTPAHEPAANEQHEIQPEEPVMLPDETDFAMMKDIERLMTEQKPYKDCTLSVDTFAQILGVKSYIVSNAINRCTKKSFTSYINEYRTREAIRLLSEKNLKTYSINSIAFEAGFNDNRNFFRVFKKITGLTPTKFRNSIRLINARAVL